MRIEINDITVQNFLSFGNTPQKLDFTTGLNLIKGTVVGRDCSNGAGKSSIADALYWCLYGKVARDINQNDLINWRNRKDCKVDVNFTKGNNKYRVSRGLKPHFLEIYENDRLIPFQGKRDYQDNISWDIIGLHHNTFINLIYANLNYSTPVLKMNKGQKRYFIEKLFNLEIFTRLNENCKNKLRSIERRLSEITLTRSFNITQINETQKDIEITTNKLKELSSSRKVLQETRALLDTYNEDELQEVNTKLQHTLTALTVTKEQRKKVAYALQNKIRDVNNRITVLESVTSERKLAKFEAANDTKRCPTCNQSITDKSTIDKIRHEAEKYKENIERIKRYKIVITLLEPLFEDYKLDLEALIYCIRDEQKEIDKVTSDFNRIIELKHEIELLENNIIQENKLKTEYEERIKDNNSKISRLTEENGKLNAELVRLDSLQDYLNYTKEACKDEMIKQYAIASIMPFLNKYTNQYLAEVGHNFYIELDKFMDAKIRGPGIHGNSYANLSGGEGKAIDISFQMALHDIARIKAANFVDILFCDEILDSSVDNVNITPLIGIIQKKQKKDSLKAYIISHRNEIDEIEFDNVVTITKTGGFSKLT